MPRARYRTGFPPSGSAQALQHSAELAPAIGALAKSLGMLLLSRFSLPEIDRLVKGLEAGTLRSDIALDEGQVRLALTAASAPRQMPADGEALAGVPFTVAAPGDEAHWQRVAEATARAVRRGDGWAAGILARDDMLTGEDFGKKLGVSRDTVNRWRLEGKVLALEGSRRGVRYPAWQIGGDGRLMPGIGRVTTAGRDRPWTTYRILTEPQPALGGLTGCEAMGRGSLDAVVSLVEHYGSDFS